MDGWRGRLGRSRRGTGSRSGSARSSGAGAGSRSRPRAAEQLRLMSPRGRDGAGEAAKPGTGFPPAASARPRGLARLGIARPPRERGGHRP